MTEIQNPTEEPVVEPTVAPESVADETYAAVAEPAEETTDAPATEEAVEEPLYAQGVRLHRLVHEEEGAG